jgi:hypothetical protein
LRAATPVNPAHHPRNQFEEEILVKTATIGVTQLTLLLLATPAAADFLGPPPPPQSGLPKWLGLFDKPKEVAPYWVAWTAAWDTVVKTEEASWPDPPRVPVKVSSPRGLRLVPPPQYDHPYSGPGKLRIIYASSQDEVRQLCPLAVFPKAGAYGCAHSNIPEGCLVVIAPAADIKAVGLTTSLVIRHETGHCNGWPGDHHGALSLEDWAVLAADKPAVPPIMAAAEQFDNFARSAVGKTVAEIADKFGRRAGQIILAAKDLHLELESRVTRQVLGDSVAAKRLAEGAGIGANLNDNEWEQAYALAHQTSRLRQGENTTPADIVGVKSNATFIDPARKDGCPDCDAEAN